MNIERGKFYKTRGGNKVRIYATDGARPHSTHGAIHIEGGWRKNDWLPPGRLGTVESDHDIIAEWTDKPEVDWSAMPRWANWVAMDAGGRWCWFDNKPFQEIRHNQWLCHCQLLGVVPVAHQPNYTGCWKDSLAERPKQ